jgi:hypothetical protein
MNFFLQWDGTTKSRAYNGIGSKEWTKINHAIAELKKKEHPHRLCVRMGANRYAPVVTLLLFEGTGGRTFNAKKLTGLVQVGKGMYIPKAVRRKTTRKRKTKCKKSNDLVMKETFKKSITRGFS